MSKSATYSAPLKFNPPTKKDLFRLWNVNENGDSYRAGARAQALKTISQMINWILCRVPVIHFSKSLSLSDTVDHDPVCRWYFPDYNDNSIAIRHKFIRSALNADDAESTSYLEQDTSADWYAVNHRTSLITSDMANDDEYFEDTYMVSRYSATAADTEKKDGFSSYGAPQVRSVIVQELPMSYPVFNVNEFISEDKTEKGDIITDIAEEIRIKLNWLHKYRRPGGFWWSGKGDTGGYIGITGTSYANIFDGTAARTATTSGFQCDVYLGGTGRLDCTTGYGAFGSQVRIYVFVYASATTQDCFVKAEGPDNVADNNVEMTWTAGAGASWKSGVIILNSSASPVIVDTTTQNKIDIFGKATDGGTLKIFAITALIDADE